MAKRHEIVALPANLPQAATAGHREVMTLIETRRLFGLGIGYVDAHLLAATVLTGDGTTLWTQDQWLRSAAEALGCHASVP